jgi:hypothetical protein
MFFMSIVTVLPPPDDAAVLEVPVLLPDAAGVLEDDVEVDELELPQPAAARANTASTGRTMRFMSTWDDVIALILPVEGRGGWGRGR